VVARDGIPVAVPGWEGVELDREKLRIEHMLRDLVEPRVAFTVREIRLANGNSVVLSIEPN
jgi:hypothetical protein